MYFKKFNFKDSKFYNKYIIYDFKILYNLFIMRFVRKVQSSKDIGEMVKLSRAVEIA